jgi:AmmeMemoRadiSam system protein B
LNAELTQNLEAAESNNEIPPKFLKALIGPHAGFRFSGPNAAWAYKNIKDVSLYDTVFILGPSHKVGFDFVAPTGCNIWDTPLGPLYVDN